ncbi:C6 transcription factor [Rasamsonia emersonii CBS 393.64]|uniref:C6 transcription factor n=1 Tax=Rasamsonia emersonii (strain ATCC 16479 / CBS 393.64 / IMI 116815) TaxID=1408163 RepID=A0A0F4Z0X0_RASE3|nr:C6 transcription factor [Rasamsonia emersonii CBS 393.64]KKA24020.1 C6 transcription factor [Rasamsonia emersonii CBS 393.64]
MSPVKSRLLAQFAAAELGASDAHSIRSPNNTESELSSRTPSSVAASPESDPLYILDPSAHQRDGRLASDLHLHDLELMHHYSTVSYKTISEREAFSAPFQTVVPKIALTHPFLMHGLLALSALHLIHLNKGSERCKDYVELATSHQTLALALFRKELNNINPSNCQALFAFSSIATVLAFGFAQSTGVQSLPPIDEMLQIFNLCRGIHGILETAREWIKNSWVSDLLAFGRSAEPGSIPPDVRDKIAAVSKLNADLGRTGFSVDEQAVCEDAISELTVSFEKIYSGIDAVTVFRWPIFLKPLYISLLRDRRPMAIVILAHYCILLHMLDNRWWLKGWTRQLLHSIYSLLDSSWREAIQWPIEAIGLFAILVSIIASQLA